ncbi:MAG: hypothetical protein WKG07_15390 [Hymenobacter sp.]
MASGYYEHWFIDDSTTPLTGGRAGAGHYGRRTRTEGLLGVPAAEHGVPPFVQVRWGAGGGLVALPTAGVLPVAATVLDLLLHHSTLFSVGGLLITKDLLACSQCAGWWRRSP